MKFWKWPAKDRVIATQHTPVPLRVVARAMCCSIGHNARATTAAINAHLNHFRETEFVDDSGDVIIGAALHDVPVWGVERLCLMLHAVVAESLQSNNAIGLETDQIAIMLLTSETERPGMPHDALAEHLADLATGNVPGMGPFHAKSAMYAYGKAGIARLLQEAGTLLTDDQPPTHVLLVAVDSLLDAGAIEHFLASERIATSDNADGFIPGEGAAALLLSPHAADRPALWVEATATALESWRINGDAPLRANALVQAIRDAGREAGIAVDDLDFHASGMTGESWYAKEVSLAITRVLEQRKPEFPHYIVASRAGETGAAAPVLTLAWLSDVMERATGSPGGSALLHFAGDDGHRAALVIRYRQ